MSTPLPRGACDCHAHIFGPESRFAYIPERSYTPRERLAADYRAMLDSLGVDRGVIVQPSVYGTDNGATLNALRELGDEFRGVAVLPPDVDDKTLSECDAHGVRGVRLSDLTTGGVPLSNLETMAERLRGTGWHIQIFAEFSRDTGLAPRIAKLGVPVVIDHIGLLDPKRGADDPAIEAVLGLLRDSDCWMKLSGAYLTSREPLPYPDVAPIASVFVERVPDRLVWATDWPHPACGDNPPDDAPLLDILRTWAPDDAVRHRILVENPARLYGFPE